MEPAGFESLGDASLGNLEPIEPAGLLSKLSRTGGLPDFARAPEKFERTAGIKAFEDRIVLARENPLPTIEVMRFLEVTPIINLTAHIPDAQIIAMDGKRWRAFSEAERKILESVFNEAAGTNPRDRSRPTAHAVDFRFDGAPANGHGSLPT